MIVYAIHDPENVSNRLYIGQTKKLLSKRLTEHLSESRRNKKQTPKRSWILSLLARATVPEIVALEEVEDREADDAECFWIGYFKGIGASLLNVTAGGESTRGVCVPGMLGKKHSDESKRLMSESMKGRPSWWRGRTRGPMSREERFRLSVSLTGRKMSPLAIAKSAAGRTGLRRTNAQRGRMSVAMREAWQSIGPTDRRKSTATRQRMSDAWKKRSPRVNKVCSCGVKFSVKASRAETAKYCSRACSNNELSVWRSQFTIRRNKTQK